MYVKGKGYTPTGDSWKPSVIQNRNRNFLRHNIKGTGLSGGFDIDYENDVSNISEIIEICMLTESYAAANYQYISFIRDCIEENSIKKTSDNIRDCLEKNQKTTEQKSIEDYI